MNSLDDFTDEFRKNAKVKEFIISIKVHALPDDLDKIDESKVKDYFQSVSNRYSDLGFVNVVSVEDVQKMEMDNLLSQITALDKMIENCPKEHVIDLISLKARRDDVMEEIQALREEK